MEEPALYNDLIPVIAPKDIFLSAAIIIVHWINIRDTIECLESISKIKYPCLSVILVNNGSIDFNETKIREVLPEVKIVELVENLGFAGGSKSGYHQSS